LFILVLTACTAVLGAQDLTSHCILADMWSEVCTAHASTHSVIARLWRWCLKCVVWYVGIRCCKTEAPNNEKYKLSSPMRNIIYHHVTRRRELLRSYSRTAYVVSIYNLHFC
jgi:hypothetical protein